LALAKIDRPVFVIGCGRSGTTLLFRLLTKHPDLAWFSNYQDWYPNQPWIGSLSGLWELPFLGPKLAGRIPGLLGSHESINIYKHCSIHDLIWKRQASLTELDVSPEARRCFREYVARTLSYRGKTRFVNKDTNNCMRIRYLKAIFPDALFIHIIRDGRAVAYSLYKVDWWPKLTLWWAGFTPQEWQATGKPPIELCARHWCREVNEIQSALAELDPKDHIQVRYEDLASEPLTELKRLIEFTGLPWTARYETSVRKVKIENLNFKWKERLSASERDILQATLGDLLDELGYPVTANHASPVNL
jgi:hypothetical protein